VPDVKTCPECAEDVKSAARLCRFCGHGFDGSRDSVPPPGDVKEPSWVTAAPAPAADGPNPYVGAGLRIAALLLLMAFGWALTIAGGGQRDPAVADSNLRQAHTALYEDGEAYAAKGYLSAYRTAAKPRSPAVYYAGLFIFWGTIAFVVAALVYLSVKSLRRRVGGGPMPA
jgi:hypothetical protein